MSGPFDHRLAVATLAVIGTAGCGGHRPPAGPTKLSAREIAQKMEPAIVRIEALPDRVGTGFVLDPTGVIATNLHVVAGAREIHVKMLDGTQYDVKRIAAFDMDRDLALIDIDPPKAVPIVKLGDSDKVAAGDPIVAIGNPMGVLDYSVSDGLISSVRVLSDHLTILQISAPISQGSSGGPLFNQYGEVVGVATAILTQGQNLNFAVPGNYIRGLLATQKPVSLDQFAQATSPPDDGAGGGGPDVKVQRKVPMHDMAVLDGCSTDDLKEIYGGIQKAIEVGAPLYNSGNHEACYRIYEGTSMRLEREAPCQGVRAAFGDGLLRANTLTSWTEKAWALRDAFDGMIDVIERKAQQLGTGGGAGAKPGAGAGSKP